MNDKLAVVVHVIAGIITALSAFVCWSLPLALLASFGLYEIWQRKDTHDKAYPALLEYMIGLFATVIILLIMKQLGMVEMVRNAIWV